MQHRAPIRTAAIIWATAFSMCAYAGVLPDEGFHGEGLPDGGAQAERLEAGWRPPTEGQAPAGLELAEAEEEPQPGGISMDWDAEEGYLLAKLAMAEAEGEDTEGKALVILVVLNRVWGDGFPDTIEEVVYQPGQFSPVADGRFDSVEPDADCWAALDLVAVDKWDGSRGATFFEAESDSTWHREHLDFLFQHGGHYFYKERG